MRVVFTGGGTGGHIIPIFAIIEELKKTSPQIEILYLGSGTSLEKEFLKKAQIKNSKIISGKWRRYFSLQNFIDLGIKIPLGVIQSLIKLLIFMPDVIFSKGGYAALPISIVAKLYRIPVIAHESDTIPGLSNLFATRFSDYTLLGFPQAKKYFKEKHQDKLIFVGNPVRESIFQGNAQKACEIFNLDPQRQTILIMGGSQGAKKINEAIIPLLPFLTNKYQVVHIAGEKNVEAVKVLVNEYRDVIDEKNYHLLDFVGNDLKHLYAATKLIISRSGASAIAEISALGLPSIVIPLESSARDHQKTNAYFYSQGGACLVIEEPNLTRGILENSIKDILENSQTYESMSRNAKEFYIPHVAQNIAELILEYEDK
jgi:UDP-N-acetylglucosamine--N-acetylmuramyl-(pentapeptide) pyrophosphoryl-undecaprenol N-acetylglucosamine transferase